jgi:hypothetical protein
LEEFCGNQEIPIVFARFPSNQKKMEWIYFDASKDSFELPCNHAVFDCFLAK